MVNRIPITKYQMKKIVFYSKIGIISFIAVFLLGNIIAIAVKDSVKVDRNSYTLKEGFPLFTSEKAYIQLLKNYPYDPGVSFTIHKIKKNESYWDITRKYNVTIDTIIAANPFIETLRAEEGTEIVIPSEKGMLFAFDDILDVWRMSEKIKFTGKIRGNYKPEFFRIFSTDDIRFVFFKGAEPGILNNSIGRLYSYKKMFRLPVNGTFSSLFGNRIDPFHHGIAFHDGIDILAKYGTPIYPAKNGIVSFTGWRDGLGKTITVIHDNGYVTIYGHCSKILVKKGDRVTEKDMIGLVGSTGRSTGPHLHFVIMRHGETINPILFIW